VVIADETADPRYVAADLSSQLEHDPLAFALLVTDSEKLARLVEREMESVNAAHCCLVLVDSIAEAIEVANDFAPEHLELLVDGAERWIAEIDNAGAIFVGPHTAVSLGDYVIGTNHTLPTAGAARFGSPLGVHTFLKRTSVAKLDQKDLESLQQAARALARMEGLPAHARAVEVRLGD
jgi:histidinol dehydrogenase